MTTATGAAFSNAGVEIIAVRARGTASLPPPARVSSGTAIEKIGARPVIFRDPTVAVQTDIYSTVFPAEGTGVQGPAIIEFPGQSVVIPPGMVARADAFGNLHVRQSA